MTDNRTTELLNCPFCGGEAHFTVSSDGYGVECDGELCFKTIMQEHPTEEYAARAWNTRHVETCENIEESCFECSECGFFDSWADAEKVNYCPNCGAKVVTA